MRKSREIALGGMLAALSIIIMCLGTIFPFMTYVSPRITTKTGYICWYLAVTILSLLLCPDKEAAAVFSTFGTYPLFRFQFEKLPFKVILKLLYFNLLVLMLYWILLHVVGMAELQNEFEGVSLGLAVFMLIIGNVVFILFDRMLRKIEHSNVHKFSRKRGRI